MMTRHINNFIECLDEQRYFDAHEALEIVWFPRRFEDDNEVKLLKGFINAAVSFELAKRGKHEQSKKVWQNYLKYKELLHKTNSPHIKLYQQTAIYLESKQV